MFGVLHVALAGILCCGAGPGIDPMYAYICIVGCQGFDHVNGIVCPCLVMAQYAIHVYLHSCIHANA